MIFVSLVNNAKFLAVSISQKRPIFEVSQSENFRIWILGTRFAWKLQYFVAGSHVQYFIYIADKIVVFISEIYAGLSNKLSFMSGHF